MARRRTKTPVEGGQANFLPQRNAMQNGAQEPASADASDYPAAADRDNQPAVRSDRVQEGRPLDDEELGAMIQQELEDARTYIDLEIGPMRAYATEAYRGGIGNVGGDMETGLDDDDETAYNPTEQGITSRDVRDTILGLLPDLMRIFTSSPDAPVEFQPTNQAEVDMAQQATDYALYVFMRDNPGFFNLHSAFKDAMKYKTGILKTWWDTSERVQTEHYRNIDPLGFFLLDQDPSVERIEILKEFQSNDDPPSPLVDLRIKRRIKGGRICVQPLPPEEFLIDRRARSLDEFTLLAHRRMATVSELVALGFDEDEVRQYVTSPELDTNIEYIARQPWARVVGSFEGMNPALQRVLYCEAYAWVDTDGDGVAELHRIHTMGPSYKIVKREAVDHHPFGDFQCDPEPHTFFGESVSDATMDIQRVKTQIWRDTLDSLAQSIRPRMAIVEGQVNYDDVLNNEIGAIIRQRAPGMVTPLETPFVGQNAFPMIEYADSVLEKRTGVSLQSMGLDADALQSTTQLAVMQQISGSQGRVELLARILAEGLRKVFRIILRLSVMNQDKPRTVQIRGTWTRIDPRYWNADMSIETNVALGRGPTAQQIQTLMGVKQTQENILQLLGPSNPICSLSQYAYTLRKIVELAGFKNSTAFFNAVPPNAQIPPAPQQPNPQMISVQQEGQIAQARLGLDHDKMILEHQRLSQKDAADIALREKELSMKYGVQVHSNVINAALAADQGHQQQIGDTVRHGMTQQTNARTAAMQQQTAREQMAADAAQQQGSSE